VCIENKIGTERLVSSSFLLLDGHGAEVLAAAAGDTSLLGRYLFVKGRCMAPIILPGDRLEVEPLARAPEPGVVVVYEAGGKLLAHRVIRVEGERFWARGDASGVTDGPCALSVIRGRVVAVERGGRRLAVGAGRASLARGRVLAGARGLAARFPGLRRRIEVGLLGGPVARGIGRRVGAWLLGRVRIEQEADPSRALAELLGSLEGSSPAYLEELERLHRDGALVVLRANAARRGEIGRLILLPLPGARVEAAALVHTLAVDLGFRGAGVGARLLDRALEACGQRGWLRVFARVAAGNERSLGLFRARGFFEAAPWERPAGMRAEDHWLARRLAG